MVKMFSSVKPILRPCLVVAVVVTFLLFFHGITASGFNVSRSSAPVGRSASEDDPTSTSTVPPCSTDPQPCEAKRTASTVTPNPYTGLCTNDSNALHNYRCTCTDGFHNSPDDPSLCIDINECAASPNPCEDLKSHTPNAYTGHCTNTPGSYECTCSSGFKQDASKKLCEDINECAASPNPCEELKAADEVNPPNAYTGHCTNTPGSYECSCSTGFKQDDAKIRCLNINECADGTHTCPDVVSTCIDTKGSFECQCKEGYENPPGGSQQCVDIDECAVPPDTLNPCEKLKADDEAHPPNAYTGECTNTQGSYECICTEGFKKDDSKIHCIDIDECESSDLNDCNAANSKCQNTKGSYRCECQWGWQGNPENNRECHDINECIQGVDGDPDLKACDDRMGICQNTDGAYTCKCYDGYDAAVDPPLEAGCHDCCIDRDECELKEDGCGDICEFGTHDKGAPLGTNYTCKCETGRYPHDEYRCGDCFYDAWSDWGSCNVTCGKGSINRTRVVAEGYGEDAPECNKPTDLIEFQPCVQPPCPGDACELSPWSTWTDCSKECGGGEQERTRTILSERSPGACDEFPLKETRDCHTQPCEGLSASDVNWMPIAIAGGAAVGAVALGALFFRKIRRSHRQEEYM